MDKSNITPIDNGITPERRLFIEQLKREAGDYNSLMIDTLNIAELLHSIVMFKDTMNSNFYYNLQSTFYAAIRDKPSNAPESFQIYSEIMKLLMSLMTNYELIQNKANEYNKLADDLETIDNEN